jgi:DNA repair exonuclease SbcCD nuclease subunit
MATADVHLGMKFGSYREFQSELVEARFVALERVVTAANDSECNLLVVAGDLFHRVGVASPVVSRCADILAEFGGEAAVVLPGNHDYLNPGEDRLWKSFGNAAGDRTVVLDAPRAFDLRVFDLDLVVLAGPCDSLHGTRHRLEWLDSFDRSLDMPHLGVCHGSISGLTLDSEGRYFPVTKELLAGLPADLWIVGHTHRHHHLRANRLVVPGTPEPDGFDCAGSGTAALIELSRDGHTVEPIGTGSYSFATVAVDLDPLEDVRAQLDRAVPEDALVRLDLTGSLPGGNMADLSSALDELRSRLPYLRTDDSGLRTVIDRQDVDELYPSGSFAHRLLESLLDAGDGTAASVAAEILDSVRTGGGPT